MDKRFNLKLTLDVQELKDGQPVPFFETMVGYSEIPQDAVLAIEAELIALLQKLNQYGVKMAEEKGVKLGMVRSMCQPPTV